MRIENQKLIVLRRIEAFLEQRQIKAYLVGGFVRDLLTGRDSADIDLATQADALTTAQEMAATFEGKYVLLDEEYGLARVVFFSRCEIAGNRPCYVDLSTLSGEIEDDLARRDFTINAMALPLKCFLEIPPSLEVIDPFQGRADLDRRLIRVVSRTVFQDDPLRLLRAIRLSAELDLAIPPDTEELIRQSASLITQVSGERIHEELVRIFGTFQTGRFVRYMDDLGLLTSLFPELESGRSIEQPQEHHWQVLDHAIETVSAAGFLLRQGEWSYGDSERLREIPWSDDLDRFFQSEVVFGVTQAALFKLAALLHDIAKPETRILDKERIRFFGHDQKGADTVKDIMERLRFSKKETDLVEKLVRFHMRPTQIGHLDVPSPRAVFRYFRDTGSAGISVLFLSLADHLAARGPNLDTSQWHWHVNQVSFLLHEYFNKKEVVSPPRLIDGHDLIRIFSLKPGPEIREILDSVREAQAAGEIATRDAALSYVENRLLYIKQNLEG